MSTAAAMSWIWSRKWHISARATRSLLFTTTIAKALRSWQITPIQIKIGQDMENVLLGLDFILFAQTIALMKSLSLGITPDNPCPTGEVNRVVKGVTLYPYTLK